MDPRGFDTPFDPLIWYRARAARLFDFAYRVETHVPRPGGRWGYYALPFLLGDRLVARVDLKADRHGRRLLVLAAHIERHATPGQVAQALAAEFRTMPAWLGLESVVVSRQGDQSSALAVAVRSLSG